MVLQLFNALSAIRFLVFRITYLFPLFLTDLHPRVRFKKSWTGKNIFPKIEKQINTALSLNCRISFHFVHYLDNTSHTFSVLDGMIVSRILQKHVATFYFLLLVTTRKQLFC